jgi:hypothetical protein
VCVCAPTQRKPFELIVIKTPHSLLICRLLARLRKPIPNAKKRAIAKINYWEALPSSWIAKPPGAFHARSRRCSDPEPLYALRFCLLSSLLNATLNITDKLFSLTLNQSYSLKRSNFQNVRRSRWRQLNGKAARRQKGRG